MGFKYFVEYDEEEVIAGFSVVKRKGFYKLGEALVFSHSVSGKVSVYKGV